MVSLKVSFQSHASVIKMCNAVGSQMFLGHVSVVTLFVNLTDHKQDPSSLDLLLPGAAAARVRPYRLRPL